MMLDICASYLQRFSLFVYVLGEWWLCIDVLNTMWYYCSLSYFSYVYYPISSCFTSDDLNAMY
jgi:hypothetical protein